MRIQRLALLLAFVAMPAFAQTIPAPEPTATLTKALLGSWTGVLEYRDYSDPATSTKRVQLPTWLAITPTPGGVVLNYTYDDGPNKVIAEHTTLALDLKAHRYSSKGSDAAVSVYTITGDDKLRDGRGELILTGAGKDNSKPSEIRITLLVRRNLLSWLEEVRPSGSAEPFTFRHRYVFTRAEAPALSPVSK